MWDITNATHPPTMRGASLQWPDQGRERVVGGAMASMLVLTTTAGPEPPFRSHSCLRILCREQRPTTLIEAAVRLPTCQLVLM